MNEKTTTDAPRLTPIRLVFLALVFAHFFFATPFFGAASHSEQFYIALCWTWIFNALFLQQLWFFKRHLVAPTIFAAIVFFLLFRYVTWEQARFIEGRASWSEAVWKMWHVGGLFVLYALWSRAWFWIFTILRRDKTIPAALWLRLTARGVAILTFAPLIFTSFNIHRTKIGNALSPQSVNLPFEAVSFDTSDDLRLRGWWIPAAKPTRKAVVVCHGIGANSGNFLGVAPFLHRAGFNVLFFDFRGHGDSPGHTISLGWDEARDVRAACKYLQTVRGQKEVALYGFSMGGASVNLAFHPRFDSDVREGDALKIVRAVVVDSTFAELQPLVQQNFAFLPPSLQPPLMAMVNAFSQLEIGVAPSEIAPSQTVARISPRPMLIIHGDADQFINVAHAHRLFAAAREPKELFIVRGAGHCLCRLVNPPPYEKRVTNWLQTALK